jgi:hypothetical protein
VIGDPPVFGAVKLTEADAFPADATTFVGVEGFPTGVTAADGVEEAEFPTEFLATAVKVYAVPLVKPVISQPVVGLVVVQVRPPGEDVITYSVTADPPLSVGAVSVIVALPGELVVAVTPVGAAGTVAGVIAMVAVEESDIYAPLLA